MPILLTKIAPAPGFSPTKAEIAKTLAALSTHYLRKKPELTSVAVDMQAPDSWFVGGASLESQTKASFWCEIKIVDGTNTKDEKAAFLAATFAAMEKLLGPLHHESYVHVDEVSADAYGFGGLTQERRYIAAQIAA